MHYLIDGHNLIGKMPDIDLEDPDDEVKLVFRLRSWSAAARKRRVTVVFDHGLPGGIDKGLSTGKVRVIFASSSQTADAILIGRIKRAKNPREFTLVTDDNRILREAKSRRMPIIRAQDFSAKLSTNQPAGSAVDEGDGALFSDEPQLSEDEMDMWLDLFGGEQN